MKPMSDILERAVEIRKNRKNEVFFEDYNEKDIQQFDEWLNGWLQEYERLKRENEK